MCAQIMKITIEAEDEKIYTFLEFFAQKLHSNLAPVVASTPEISPEPLPKAPFTETKKSKKSSRTGNELWRQVGKLMEAGKTLSEVAKILNRTEKQISMLWYQYRKIKGLPISQRGRKPKEKTAEPESSENETDTKLPTVKYLPSPEGLLKNALQIREDNPTLPLDIIMERLHVGKKYFRKLLHDIATPEQHQKLVHALAANHTKTELTEEEQEPQPRKKPVESHVDGNLWLEKAKQQGLIR